MSLGLVLLVLFLLVLVICCWNIFWLSRAAHKGHRPRVVILGCSVVRGQIGAGWVPILRRLFPRIDFVNAGVNSHTSYDMLKRLEADVLALQPDIVLILAGVNDCIAAASSNNRLVRAFYRLPAPPSLDNYRSRLSKIMYKIAAAGVEHRAILTLPPLGEVRDSRANKDIVAPTNHIIKDLSKQHGYRLLDLNKALWDYIDGCRRPYEDRQVYDGVPLLPLSKAMIWRYIFKYSWDEIAESNGLCVLVDKIHLSDRGAQVMVALVQKYLASLFNNGIARPSQNFGQRDPPKRDPPVAQKRDPWDHLFGRLLSDVNNMSVMIGHPEGRYLRPSPPTLKK